MSEYTTDELLIAIAAVKGVCNSFCKEFSQCSILPIITASVEKLDAIAEIVKRSENVVEVVRGEWIEAKIGDMSLYPYGQKMCSNCHAIMPSTWTNFPPFCYGCGAKMDGERKEVKHELSDM